MLDSIKFVERSQNTYIHVYLKDDLKMRSRESDQELLVNPDFVGTPEEHYDVFYSNADGTVNEDGNYITVECTFAPVGGGLNIDEVHLVFTDLTEQCACAVASAAYFGSSAILGSADNAADCTAGTWSTMGNTTGSERLRITLSFDCGPMVGFCFPNANGVRACPCGNPSVPDDGTRGCNNYGPNPAGGTGGAILAATGSAIASPATTLVFHVTEMQTPCSLVLLFRGTSTLNGGVISGGGVRCVSGLQIPRMYKTVTTFNAGSVDFPSPDAFPIIDPWTRSNSPAAGTTQYFYAAYRNGQLGNHPPCTPATAFNLTNAGAVVWHH